MSRQLPERRGALRSRVVNLSGDPNAYAPPVSVDRGIARPSRHVGPFVVGTMLGVFVATVWRSSLRFVLARLGSSPLYYVMVYAIAASVAIVVAPFARMPSRIAMPPRQHAMLRAVGGFVLGCTPYFVGDVLSAVWPSFGAAAASIHPTLATLVSVAIGAAISVVVESMLVSAALLMKKVRSHA